MLSLAPILLVLYITSKHLALCLEEAFFLCHGPGPKFLLFIRHSLPEKLSLKYKGSELNKSKLDLLKKKEKSSKKIIKIIPAKKIFLDSL